MRFRRSSIVLLTWLSLAAPVRSGLYYSDETLAELPSQWRGFLLDQRLLRNIGLKSNAANPPRARYEKVAARLEKTQRERKLTADEQADLGALYVRLGDVGRAVTVLRSGAHEHPSHFRILANLGTAWQVQGDLVQAAACLEQAVRLAPGKLQRAEELQLRLVRLRQRESVGAQALDDLFGARFADEAGRYTPGQLAVAERKKLPSDAVALVQQLALWLPNDGRLLWQLAELANAAGDVRMAAAIMDGCVTEFGLHSQELRQHRQLLRTAADELAKADGTTSGATTTHSTHVALFRPRSKRPLRDEHQLAALPPVRVSGVNALPWSILAETTLDRKFKPTFADYLKELDGKQVSLAGFMQPLGEQLDLHSFLLIEYPVGCWYCEMPEPSGIVLVELADKSARFRRSALKVTGTLRLNGTDPETFLYTIQDAHVTEAD
jgi:hypothetical protein